MSQPAWICRIADPKGKEMTLTRLSVAAALAILAPVVGGCAARSQLSTSAGAVSQPTSSMLGRWENVELLDAGTRVDVEFRGVTRRGRVQAVTADLLTLDVGDASGPVAVPRTEVRRIWERRSGNPKWAALGALIGGVVGYVAGGLIVGDSDAVHPGVRYHHVFLGPIGAAGGALAGVVSRPVLIYRAP
jgi:hypothetical protein